MDDTIQDAERIRDELFRITLGLWNYAKYHNPRTIVANANRELVWLNYVPGGGFASPSPPASARCRLDDEPAPAQ